MCSDIKSSRIISVGSGIGQCFSRERLQGRLHTNIVTYVCEKVGSEGTNLIMMNCGETSNVAIQDMIGSSVIGGYKSLLSP